MKLFYKNSGSGSLLIRIGTQKFTIKAGVNTVPDDVGDAILAKNIKGISTDEEAKAAKTGQAAALSENEKLKARVKELEAQVAKLQVIAAQVPPAPESALSADAPDAPAKAKRGPKPKTVAESPAVAVEPAAVPAE